MSGARCVGPPSLYKRSSESGHCFPLMYSVVLTLAQGSKTALVINSTSLSEPWNREAPRARTLTGDPGKLAPWNFAASTFTSSPPLLKFQCRLTAKQQLDFLGFPGCDHHQVNKSTPFHPPIHKVCTRTVYPLGPIQIKRHEDNNSLNQAIGSTPSLPLRLTQSGRRISNTISPSPPLHRIRLRMI